MIAMEVIKLLTGCGTPLLGKLWYSDLRTNETRIISIQRRPDCAVCGHI
jgi:molybdopterin-synthase adenylyltransferase